MKRKNRVIPKQRRYTARYPAAIPQSILMELGTIKSDTELVESSQNGTFCMAVASPGLNIMQATMVPNNSMIAYIILLDDEFLHDGHALQQRPQAALPQQQANYIKKGIRIYQQNK